MKLVITNPGNFPFGVTLDNLLTTPSTPRNRLLTDILQKTGIVERSGLGVDKIFYQTLKEGKLAPDYTKSDDFFIVLSLSAVIEDKAFALFIEAIQSDLPDTEKLSVLEVIHLNEFRKENKIFKIDKSIIASLLQRGLIEKRGKTSGTFYVLSKKYYEFTGEEGKYTKGNINQDQVFSIIHEHLKNFGKAKMKDFEDLLETHKTRKQVRNIVSKLVDQNYLDQNGKAKGTYYTIGSNYSQKMKIALKALNIGMEQLKKDGEI